MKFVENFVSYIYEKVKILHDHPVFDHYHPDRIKGLTRMNRDTGASRIHNCLPEMQLPSRDVVLRFTKNKEQLIELIVNKIKTDTVKIRNIITVTGKDPIPFKITNGCTEERTDLKTNQEEADTILIHQVAAMGPGKAVVISEDTNMFVLLLHFLSIADIKVNVLIEPTSHSWNPPPL